MTSRDLARRLSDAPFKPFRIKMVNNETFDVYDPGMVIFRDSSAVVATQHIRDERAETASRPIGGRSRSPTSSSSRTSKKSIPASSARARELRRVGTPHQAPRRR